jgi:hypothetical protein
MNSKRDLRSSDHKVPQKRSREEDKEE